MKKIERRVVKVDRDFTIEWTCDLCGGDMRPRGSFRVLETEVTLKEGTSYPTGDYSAQHTDIDICATCFKNRLIPWVESHGATITSKEVSH